MPEIQAATALAWGDGTSLQAATALAWGDGAQLQSRGSPYTQPDPGAGTPITIGGLAPLRDIQGASTYVDITALQVLDLRDGEPLPVEEVALSLLEGADLWSMEIAGPSELADRLRDGEQPATLEVQVGAEVWRFVVEDIEQALSFSDTGVTVRGRSLAAAAGAPYQAEQVWLADAPTSAAQLAALANTYTGLAVQWELADWLVPAGAWSATTDPLGVVRQMAAAVGAVVEAHPSELSVTVRSRYPTPPNTWGSSVPDVQIAWDAFESARQERADQPLYDGVLVAGQQSGGLLQARLDGTAGAVQAPMVTDQLLTETSARLERAAALLHSFGGRARETRTLQLHGGVIRRGALVRCVEPSATWVGMVRAVSVRATLAKARQTLTMERPTSFPAGSAAPEPIVLPPPPIPADDRASVILSHGQSGGLGIVRSTDAGLTLSALELVNSQQVLSYRNIGGTDGEFASVGFYGPWRKVGGVWQAPSPLFPESLLGWKLVWRPGVLLAAPVPASSFDAVAARVTLDGGASWGSVGSAIAIRDIVYCEASSLYIYTRLSDGVIFTSPTMATVTSRGASTSRTLAVGGSTVIAGSSADSTYLTLSRSTDGGLTWSQITTSVTKPGLGDPFIRLATNGSGIWVASAEALNKGMRSTDDGATWSAMTLPAPAGRLAGPVWWTGTEFIWGFGGSGVTSQIYASPDGSSGSWTLRNDYATQRLGFIFPANPFVG